MYFCGLEHIAHRSTESFHATETLLIPQTLNFAVSLTLKTRVVTECDLILPQAFERNRQLKNPQNVSLKLCLGKLQYVINVCAKFKNV